MRLFVALFLASASLGSFWIHVSHEVDAFYDKKAAMQKVGAHSADNLTGRTEAAVRSDLGMPHREFSGHYGNPPADFTSKLSGDVKTCVFKKPGGQMYVSFENRHGTWIVICNSWLPGGAAF
jgi:hypothetical protein